MVIKVTKKNKRGKIIKYKSSKLILTPQDIKNADAFDTKLNDAIKKIEEVLLGLNIVYRKKRKKDPLEVWHIIGEHINAFLRENHVNKDDEHIFWEHLYGKSPIIHSGIPINKVGLARNDFRTAAILAKYPLEMLRKVGSWALWREILGYRNFLNDKRVLNWVIDELIKTPRTRDEARPFLKAVSARLNKIDTSVLNDKELLKKLREI